MYNREQAKDYFLSYAEQYDTQNILIRHKVEHTLRVAELCERYSKAVGMCAEDVDFAWLLGLWHDIGRFEQARRYGTFVDSQSVDHAELSGDILFREGLAGRFPQEGLPEDWPAAAETAIRLHNKLSLPEALNSRIRRFAEILRDADKTDIFRVIAEIPFEDRVGSSRTDVHRYENAGHKMNICTFFQYCRALETDPGALAPEDLPRAVADGRLERMVRLFSQLEEADRDLLLRTAERLPKRAG